MVWIVVFVFVAHWRRISEDVHSNLTVARGLWCSQPGILPKTRMERGGPRPRPVPLASKVSSVSTTTTTIRAASLAEADDSDASTVVMDKHYLGGGC